MTLNSLLKRAIVKVVLSVCHNRDSDLNGLRCWNTYSETADSRYLCDSWLC